MVFKRANKRNLISTLVSIALLILFSVLIEGNITLRQLGNLIFIYSIAALALNIICGCLGEFVLGHGGFLLVGYTVAVLVGKFICKQFDPAFYAENVYTIIGQQIHPLGYLFAFITVIIAALITGVIGFLVGTIALGRLKGDYLAIVTLGISLVFVNIAKNVPMLGGTIGIGVTMELGASPWLYALFLVFTIFLILTFMKSRFGRAILACRDDNIAAEACGVPVSKTKLLAFTFATFITGIAGGLFALYSSYQPDKFGQDISILFLIIIVLGGLGSLTGSIMASIVIVFYENWFCMQSWVPDFFASNPKIIYGLVLVIIMLFRPNGLLGTSEFTWKWFYSKLKVLLGVISKRKPGNESLKEVK